MEFERTKYRTIIDHLHAQNVGKYIELPQIAVMGDWVTPHRENRRCCQRFREYATPAMIRLQPGVPFGCEWRRKKLWLRL